MRAKTILGFEERETLTRLGRTIRLARLRRNLSQEEFAARMGVSRSSVIVLEQGGQGVAVGILARALAVLGYPKRLGTLLATDPLGEDLELLNGRQRAKAEDGVADF